MDLLPRRNRVEDCRFGSSLGSIRLLLSFGLCVMLALPMEAREAWLKGKIEGSPLPPAPYKVDRILPAARFANPVDLAPIPGTQLIMVADQSGALWSLNLQDPQASPNLVTRLKDHHSPFDSILGITFHPGFVTNRFMFINYNEPGGRTNGSYVSRFTLSSVSPPQIDLKSEKVIIQWLSGGHNGCSLVFGKDGYLYISTGDATSPDPPDHPFKTGQDISDLLASVLRIDVNRTEPGKNYSIPSDNPFRDHPGARPEVWAFGFRNPYRMSIDHESGDVWVGDVGWEQYEMIYRLVAGGNYGWPITEGPNLKVRTDVKQGPGQILPPTVAISHVDGASITGGVVYRGNRLPKLKGAYIYGDWETGRFWALRHSNGTLVSNEDLCDTALKPAAFSLDSNGELLILDYSGGLYRLIPNDVKPSGQPFPRKLSQTGLFTSLRPLQSEAGVFQYSVRAPMWNDHATSKTYLAVPGTGVISPEGGVGNIAGGTPRFPTNTVFVKSLALEFETGNASSRREVETQLMHWDGQTWSPYSYRWNDSGTEAELVGNQGDNSTWIVKDPNVPGGQREVLWRYGSRSECLRCHNAWAGEIIGFNSLQLGSLQDTSSEAARLSKERLATIKETDPNHSKLLVNPYNTSASVDHRARSWLHSNCAGCHRFGAGGSAAIHLNADKPLNEMRAVDERPLRGDFGITDARIVAPGDPYGSALFYRIRTEGSGHMPQLGGRFIDEVGVALVKAWIESLPTKPTPGQRSERIQQTKDRSRFLSDLQAEGFRVEALDSLTQNLRGALQVAQELKTLKAREEVARRYVNHSNPLIRDLFQQWLPHNQRRKTLGAEIHPKQILNETGDANRGKSVFSGTAQCSRCHKVEGVGDNFGPDLASVKATESREQILDHILNPSRVVAQGFATTTVELRNGDELVGFVITQDAEGISIRDSALTTHRIITSQVKEIRTSSLSAMPEGLLAPLTVQEAADLLEYLTKLRNARR